MVKRGSRGRPVSEPGASETQAQHAALIEFGRDNMSGQPTAPPPGFNLLTLLEELAGRQSKQERTPRHIEQSKTQTQEMRFADIFADHLLIQLGLSPESTNTLNLRQKQYRFVEVIFSHTREQLCNLMESATSEANLIFPTDKNAIPAAFDRKICSQFFPEFEISPLPFSDILKRLEQSENLAKRAAPPIVGPPEADTHGAKMVEQDKKLFIKDDVRYRPLPVAAQLAQAPRQTLLNWIKNKTEFGGRPLQSYYLAPVDRYFISEESINRIANRFVRWPSQEPAGPVILGETEDQRGYLGMSDAARIIRVSPRTMWLWASRGKAPVDKPLDVIKCTTSDHFYIREESVRELKKLIPRSGLQRGRRPQDSAHP